MKTHLKSAIALLGLLAALPASASSWYFMSIGTSETRYFFDGDTVVKGTDKTVTLWVKSVQTRKADPGGAWAKALRWKVDCANLTFQTLGSSTYDREGAFLASQSTKGDVVLAAPESVGEGIIQIACQSNFPNDTSKAHYFKLGNNDVFQTTRSYTETFLDVKKDPAPK